MIIADAAQTDYYTTYAVVAFVVLAAGALWVYMAGKEKVPETPSTMIQPARDRPITSGQPSPRPDYQGPFSSAERQEILRLLRANPVSFDVAPRLTSIRAAIKNSWSVKIVYIDKEEQETERTIIPLSVEYNNVVYAHCTLRDDMRHFQISRIRRLDVNAVRQDARDRYRVG